MSAHGNTSADGSQCDGIPSDASTRSIELSITTLVWLATAAVILPFLILAGFGFSKLVSEHRAEELRRVSLQARALSRAVDRELMGFIETAEVLAGSRHLRLGNLPVMDEIARDTAARTGGQFILTDRDGNRVLDTDTSATEGTDTVRASFASERPVVGNLSNGNSRGLLAFTVEVPVVFAAERRYTLTYVPRVSAILEVLKESFRAPGWLAAIIDANGRIIARSERHDDFFGAQASPDLLRAMTSEHGVLETTDLEDRPSVTAFHRTALGGWRSLVWVPKSVLQAPADRMQRLVLGLLSLTAIVSTVVASFVGRAIAAPTHRLVTNARALGSGQPIALAPSLMKEANVVERALIGASREIGMREAENKLLLREVNHRSKNMLSLVLAIARQSPAASHADFLARFTARVQALSASQELLISSEWKGADVRDLVTSQLARYEDLIGTRITLTGPTHLLLPSAAQSIGMALHELATNAGEYGALSNGTGRVDVTWSIKDADGSSSFVMAWQESDGPAVGPPRRRGFGSAVVGSLVRSSLQGHIEVDFAPDGLCWRLECPSENAIDRESDESTTGSIHRGEASQ